MRAYGWFVFGLVVSFFAALTLSACTLDAGGLGDGSDPVSAISPSRADDQMASRLPTIPRNVGSSGGFSIDVMPHAVPHRIGVAGSDVLMAQYLLRNDDNVAHALQRFTVVVDSASVAANVAYTLDGSTMRADVNPPSADGSVTFKTLDTEVAAHSTRLVSVYATLSLISTNPTEPPRTGETMMMDLVSAVDETGAEIPATMPPSLQVTLRKSQLTVHPDPLTGSLRPGWQDVFRWQLSAHLAGDVAVKQLALRLDVDAADVCSLRLRRGTSYLDSAAYAVYAIEAGSTALKDVKTGCVQTDAMVYVVFTQELRIHAGSSTSFELHADVKHLETFAEIRVRFSDQSLKVTSPLEHDRDPLMSLDALPIPAIIWSDLSDALWIGDADLMDLSFVQTLG